MTKPFPVGYRDQHCNPAVNFQLHRWISYLGEDAWTRSGRCSPSSPISRPTAGSSLPWPAGPGRRGPEGTALARLGGQEA